MNYIEPKEGKVHDPAHLRPFDIELAKQGHPICTVSGREVRLLREASKLWSYDEWYAGIGDGGYWGTCIHQKETYFANNLRLAPLAVKDGKPLHVGDVIEICANVDNWVAVPYMEHHNTEDYLRWVNDYEWRWPVEVKE
jgi:hypothetical protein